MYARKLTKEELMKSGITLVTEDGHVFKGNEELIPKISKQGYFMHVIYDLDENGECIRVPNPKSAFGYINKTRSIGLHRLMWAWHYGEVPDGKVIDHLNNKHTHMEDYHLSNLACITPRENVMKERTYSTREIPCKLDRPRSYYEDKLTQLNEEYEQAKKEKKAKVVHKLRTQMHQYRARLRYYDSHVGGAA